ncbi:MAG: hypothetical protein A2V66_10040 [Ignavibacteria bacterium RBG_13_36_8]|nr:MAG: hypothetical protein A2V66_10040 [Ignavibacteria bacterium RBG_13_36_8]
MKKLFSILLLFLIFSFQQTFSQNGFNEEALDQYIKAAVDSLNVPGLAVGIVKDGNVIFAHGYGFRNTLTGDPIDPQTVFTIASCTKAFTAAAIGILVDEGKLNWDDIVTDYLPGFQLYDPYVTKEMRISDLLTHRSGLTTFDGDLLWYGTDYSRKDVVHRIRELPLKNGFRYKYGYQNVMFITAGEVIESVTGKTWDDFLKERIFKSIGMNSTSTTKQELLNTKDKAFPHLNKEPMEFLNYDNCGPAGSINSNVDDLLKWVTMWLNNGKVNDEQIISPASIRMVTSSQTILNGGPGNEIGGTHFRNYGMGWFLIDYSGRKVISHDGGLPGYMSRVLWVPEDNFGLVILTNELSAILNPVAYKILDLFLNDKDKDYITDAVASIKRYQKYSDDNKEERNSKRVLNTNPSRKLEDYAGVYTDKMYGDAEITFKDVGLTLTMVPTKELFTGKMEHWHYDTFRIKFKDPFLPEGFVTFNFNSNAKITSFKIDLPNPDFHFYNLEFKKQ